VPVRPWISKFWLLLLTLLLLGSVSTCRRGSADASTPDAASAAVASASGSAQAAPSVAPADSVSPDALAQAAPSATGSSGVSPAGRGLFYRATSPTATAYLLGSIHVAKRSLYPLSSAIETAFEQSDTLVLEVYLTTIGQMAAGARLAAAGTYPAGDSLDRHLSPRLMKRLEGALSAAGNPLPMYRRMRPWFVALTLTLLELQRLGYAPEHGIDRYFQDRASGSKQILGLETVDDQITLFSGLSDRVQSLLLEETLVEMKDLDPMMQEAFRAWHDGDGEALDRALLASMHRPEYRPLYQRVFLDRNEKMARGIDGYLKTSGTYFVVVGSGHLVGNRGVVALLRAKGHQVTQS